MRVLITNDDGIDSVGLRTLATMAVEAGLDVIVAAPHVEHSGSSASLTALQDDGRLVVHERSLAGLPDVRAIGVEASPALISFLAAREAFGPAPELVLSGINHGPNTGHAILHSGTVGAALTAATHGIPGMAVSLAAAEPEHFDTAKEVARRALAWMLEHAADAMVLNVNVPNVPLPDLRGLQTARLAAFGAVQADIAEVGEGYVTVTFSDIDAEREAGTDAALVEAGWATATALRTPSEALEVDLSGLA